MAEFVPAIPYKTKGVGQFNGSTYYIRVGVGTSPIPIGDVVDYSVTFDTPDLSNQMFLISDRGSVRTNYGLTTFANGDIKVYVNTDDGSNTQVITMNTPVLINTITTIRVRIDSSTGYCQTWFDGVADITHTFSGSLADSNTVLLLGQEQATSSRQFNGRMYTATAEGVFDYNFDQLGKYAYVNNDLEGGIDGTLYPQDPATNAGFWKRIADNGGVIVDAGSFYPITNHGGYVHNGAECSIIQTDADPAIFGGASFWGDGLTWTAKTYAELLAEPSYTTNGWYKWVSINGVCHLKECFQYDVTDTFTLAEYTKNVNYIKNGSCGGGVVPFDFSFNFSSEENSANIASIT